MPIKEKPIKEKPIKEKPIKEKPVKPQPIQPPSAPHVNKNLYEANMNVYFHKPQHIQPPPPPKKEAVKKRSAKKENDLTNTSDARNPYGAAANKRTTTDSTFG